MSDFLIDQEERSTISEQLNAVPVVRRIGRPALLNSAQKQQRINVCMDKTHQAIALQAGAGNLSAGVRIALAAWASGGGDCV